MSLPVEGSKSRTTAREHYKKIWKMSGEKPEELELPPLPKFVSYLWDWYCEVHTGEVLTFTELESWSRLTHKNITATEAEALKSIYSVYVEVQNARSLSLSNSGK